APEGLAIHLRAVGEGEWDDPRCGTAALEDDLIERLQEVAITGIQRRRGNRVVRFAAWFRRGLPARPGVPEVLSDRPGQHFKDIAHSDGIVDSLPDADVIDADGYELLGRDPARVSGRVDVVEADAAGVDDEVGALDRLACSPDVG